ncbi:QueT transporter family protein [Halolamina salifodinae]|uniref:Energy-coupling factor transport system substrate-specific component n=1 Tax=Halolamina salifodinae TaxID=1202767 RepID=A0A8T4GW04_9EURY|nr:QueT transporter family protein [Halolamina salifodinae]MBP1987079.1 energy-coupling factor transport system substrate-specific component [Halolamina salifodinae]
MRELLTMWRDTRMIMLTAVVAAVYAAVLIPFNAIVIIPGLTSVRPANVFPVIFGIMFGPAAAWGSAIGNLISDIFSGQFGAGSLGGFVGNFAFGFVSYRLWGNLGALSSGEEPDFRGNSGRQLVEYVIIAVVGSTACAAIIAWWLDILGLFPFSVFATIVTINNTLASAVLGPPLLYLVYPRIKEMGLLYPDVLRSEDYDTSAGARSTLGGYGVAATAILWVVIGVAIGVGVEGFGFFVSMGSVFNQGGSTIQMALGAVGFLSLFAFSFLARERFSQIRRN